MRTPQTPDRSTSNAHGDRRDPLAAKLALTKAVLAWERLWPSLWLPTAIALGFIALALIGVPHWIGDLTYGWGHLALLLLLGVLFLWSLRVGAVRWTPATHDDAMRRLERDSGLPHRPVSTLADRPADAGNAMGLALWKAHQQREAARLKNLKVSAPEPSMARLDRFGLRAGLAMALVLGLAIAAGNPGQRIAMAFQPDLRSPYDAAPPTLDVWINPPAYTGRVPMLLARATDQSPTDSSAGAPSPTLSSDPAASAQPERLAVPVGSVLLAKVNGGDGSPDLVLANGEGDQAGETVTAFETVGTRAHQIETPIEAGTALTIRQDGEDLAGWTITVVPDLKPTASMVEPPSATERAALAIHFAASDDYGLAAVEARIDRLNSFGEIASQEPIVLPLSLPGGAPEAVDAKDFHDLTPHPWAGQPVRITLVARDAIDQEGRSEAVNIILPERRFTHPIAQAIIEQRKRLTTEPGEKDDIAQVLMSIAVRPHQYYHDVVTFLALRTAAGRLVLNDEDAETLDAVQKLLWDTALRVEDGELSLAERELREIERKLMDLLAQDSVDQDELDKLLNEMREAIDKMLQAMAEQMREMMQNGDQSAEQMQPVDPNRVIQRQDLMDMLERARQMAQAGAKDAAREMLSQLREMMENLRAGRPQMMSPEQLAAQEMMRQLQDLAEQQQRLMDETFKNHQQEQQFGNRGQRNGGQQPFGGQPGQQPGQMQQGERGQQGQGRPGEGQPGRDGAPQGMTAEQLAQMQEQLRRQLGEFMRKLGEGMGEIPQSFGQAERSMKGAGEALGQNQPGEAVGPQGDAIEALQDGAQALSEAMQQQQQAGGGQAPTPGAQGRAQDGQVRDPLNNDGEDTQGYATDGTHRHGLPTESDLLRSRRIFDELRRRSGERSRPPMELDYIDRLLKRF